MTVLVLLSEKVCEVMELRVLEAALELPREREGVGVAKASRGHMMMPLLAFPRFGDSGSRAGVIKGEQGTRALDIAGFGVTVRSIVKSSSSERDALLGSVSVSSDHLREAGNG